MNLSPHQYYDESGIVLEYNIDYLRALKLNEISSWHKQQLELPVEYNGNLFDFDQVSQFRVLAVVMIGSGSPTGFWTTANNVDVSANAEFMLGLYTAMLTKVSVTHSQQRSMKNKVINMVSAYEVANYGIPE
jgi:hypothetical protein